MLCASSVGARVCWGSLLRSNEATPIPTTTSMNSSVNSTTTKDLQQENLHETQLTISLVDSQAREGWRGQPSPSPPALRPR
jgi:hypothetical protein